MNELLVALWVVAQPWAALGAGVAVIFGVYWTLAYLRQRAGLVKDTRLQFIADLAVRAAEQLWDGEEGAGDAKYAWVSRRLNQLGLPASAVAIEAAVYEINSMLPGEWQVGLSEPVMTGAPMVDEPSS